MSLDAPLVVHQQVHIKGKIAQLTRKLCKTGKVIANKDLDEPPISIVYRNPAYRALFLDTVDHVDPHSRATEQ
jgi:hypothetical protein